MNKWIGSTKVTLRATSIQKKETTKKSDKLKLVLK